MHRSLERFRALQRRAPMPARAKPLPRVNRKRKTKRDAVAFAEQAEICRYMQCCVCRRYGEIGGRLRVRTDGDPLLLDIRLAIAAAREWRERHGKGARVSDPHHVRSRGAGGTDADCVPLCRAHHRELDGVNGGPRTFERRHKVDLRAIASAIRQSLEKERAVA